MTQPTDEASPEQVAKVHKAIEVLKSSIPGGPLIEHIKAETGYPNYIAWSAIHALEREGKIERRYPFGYDPKL